VEKKKGKERKAGKTRKCKTTKRPKIKKKLWVRKGIILINKKKGIFSCVYVFKCIIYNN